MDNEPKPFNPMAPEGRPHLEGSPASEDLGLGSQAAADSQRRLLNQDGSFNVVKKGRSLFASLHLYHSLLTISWPRFYALVVLSYIVTNLGFATALVAAGPNALTGARADTLVHQCLDAFYFSVQTLSTIGYGAISPRTDLANLLVAVESFVGLIGVALATGLLFARFSRPRAKVIFSRKAVIALYKDITAFEFRLANERNSQLTDISATVVFSCLAEPGHGTARKFYALPLERDSIMFLALHWVVVHPIDERSPLHGMSADDLAASDGEFLILLTAMDETYSQTVHVRSSYKPEDVAWDSKFASLYLPPEDGRVVIDLSKIHDTEPLN